MIYKYLLEIRYRIFFSLIAWSFMMINCYYFKETLLYIFVGFSSTSNDNNLTYFLTTDVAEIFMSYIWLSYYVTNQITAIFVCCQLFCFLSTGLYAFEYAYSRSVLITTITCWVVCIFVLNTCIFPATWGFFLKFQEYLLFQNLTFYFEIKLKEYLVFYKSVYYLCNLVYQILILFFILLDLFNANLFIVKKLRKIFYFIFFICSTLLTPPEVVYQILISIFIILIYELITVFMVFKVEVSLK